MIHDQVIVPLERLSSGSPALDRILGGGIPVHSVTVIAGEPGSGKTIFTLQMLFHLAKQGKKCLYLTTLSEPALKLVRYMQLFSFFDQRLLDDRIIFADLGSFLRAKEVDQVFTEIVNRVERDEPDLVAIDSFKAIHDLVDEPARGRSLVYDLAVEMASWGATTLLVGEYTAEDIATQPEFAIADGIIRFTNRRENLTAVRAFEVLKLRGADFISGQHFLEIGPGGMIFYPRVWAPESRQGTSTSVADRCSTGIDGLDTLLRGGLPRNSATVVQGGTGTGKTLLGLHFLVEGARRGERGVLFTLEETPDQLRDIARGFGWDLPALEAQGLLTITSTSPVELSTDRFLDRARQLVQEVGARRAVLDSVTSAALGVASERRFRELVYALTKHLRAAGVTLVMTMEVAELLGSAQLTGHGVSSIADNVILLRYVEVAGLLARAISVLKARGVHHQTDLCRLEITEAGMRLGPPYRDFRGVLTGLPLPVQEGSGKTGNRETHP